MRRFIKTSLSVLSGTTGAAAAVDFSATVARGVAAVTAGLSVLSLVEEDDAAADFDAAGELEALAGCEAGVRAADRPEDEPDDDDLEDEDEDDGVEELAALDSILYIEAGAAAGCCRCCEGTGVYCCTCGARPAGMFTGCCP